MGQITISKAREISCLSINQITKYCGITENEFQAYENNPSEIPLSLLCKLRKLYGLPLDIIKV